MSTKRIALISAIILALGSGIIVYAVQNNGPDQVNDQTDQTDQNIDFTPATEEDQQNIDAIEEDRLQQQEQDTNNGSSDQDQPQQADNSQNQVRTNVVLTYAEDRGDTIAASAFAETDQKADCTLTLTKGAQKYTTKSTADFNVNKYDCQFSVPQSELSVGTWTAKVTYDSESATGTSNTISFEVK